MLSSLSSVLILYLSFSFKPPLPPTPPFCIPPSPLWIWLFSCLSLLIPPPACLAGREVEIQPTRAEWCYMSAVCERWELSLAGSFILGLAENKHMYLKAITDTSRLVRARAHTYTEVSKKLTLGQAIYQAQPPEGQNSPFLCFSDGHVD